ncbi:MAG: hypothetical protein A4E60_01954 [Syntrophorhabdus sp. PtaB.Bin047]|nr:MAG: hypothetical protein A4E60_01954 [Syntrophorhabdus sp. PtaB.Bin047]
MATPENVMEAVVYRICRTAGCPARTSAMGLPGNLKNIPGGGEYCPRCGEKLADVNAQEFKRYIGGVR